MFTILFTFFPRTFAECSWPASVRWKEYGGGGHLCLLSHETSQIGLKIVISRVVNKTRTRGRGRGRGLFFFLFKECCFLAIYRLRSMTVLSDALLSCEAAKACPKRARTSSEAPVSSQFHCPLPPFLCAPDQNRHTTQATRFTSAVYFL